MSEEGIRIEGIKVNDEFQGSAIMYFDYGRRIEGTMVDGEFQGPAIMYTDWGRTEGTMVDSKFQGPATIYRTCGMVTIHYFNMVSDDEDDDNPHPAAW